MKKVHQLVIFLLIFSEISYGQTFPKLREGWSFETTTFNNSFDNNKQNILVVVDRGKSDNSYILGIISNDLKKKYFNYEKTIYFLKGPLSDKSIGKIYVCDGVRGLFSFVAEATPEYSVSKDGQFIIYVDNFVNKYPDLVIRNNTNTILKSISGNILYSQCSYKDKISNASITLFVQFDDSNNRFLFTYGDFFGGFIDLPSLNLTLLNKNEYADFQETYFPDSGR